MVLGYIQQEKSFSGLSTLEESFHATGDPRGEFSQTDDHKKVKKCKMELENILRVQLPQKKNPSKEKSVMFVYSSC
ncbi:hypothetical protein NPIL_637431 [Nephila pilipes]|uniref:Uncharacterized protein n=1 Tax=Nephila pilipes TaxID=299642 RepID=A0A8X6QP32_NEPPI|nr:hypothetical protein NPIL_637431 [Nephila pilipes]